MRLIPRFRKSKDGRKDSEEDGQALPAGVDEEEGLLMPTGLAAGPGTAGADPGQRIQRSALPRAVDAESGPDEGEPRLDAESDADDAELADEAAEAETPLADAGEPTVEEAADDDPLAAFTMGAVSTELKGLTEGVEDVPINDLAEQLREIRAMLPATPAEDEEVAA